MKILFYGAGVMGSLYAARLKESGQDISVLARGQRPDFDELARCMDWAGCACGADTHVYTISTFWGLKEVKQAAIMTIAQSTVGTFV